MSKRTKITGLHITSVDLCKQGANTEADIKIMKGYYKEDILNFEEIMKSLTEDQQKIIKAEVLKAEGTAVPMTPEQKKIFDAKKKSDEELKKNYDAGVVELKKAQEEITELKGDDDDKSEEILKGLSPEQQEIFKSMQTQVSSLGEAVKKQAEAVKKAGEDAIVKSCETLAKSFSDVPMEEDEVVEVLKAAHAADNFEAVTKMFGKVSAIVKKSSLIDELGTSTEPVLKEYIGKSADEIFTLIEEEAKGLVTKSNGQSFESLTTEILMDPEHKLAKAYYAAMER